MADTKQKKAFKPGVYAVIAGVIIAVFLVAATIFAFTTRYTAFSPEKVAVAYTDTIVQTGDGYNAYKNTLVSKNQKFGNFVINAYMAPFVNDEVEQNEIIGSRTEEEAKLLDTVYSQMYDYYTELVKTEGLDNYDAVFSKYFTKLAEVRKAVIGDEYMDTEFMFGVFEANVAKYGDSLTGTDEEYEADGKTIKTEATTGIYQEMYGNDYRFTASVANVKEYTGDELQEYINDYKARITPVVEGATAKAEEYGLADDKKESYIEAFNKLDCSEVISDVNCITVDVKLDDGTVVSTTEIYVVKIGNSWYVDNTITSTTGLYLAN